ncbi:MAG: PH domain-containing protein [Candidatus Aminicenantia bacterium]
MSIFAPSSNSFRKQYPEEKTLLVTRRHWIILFAPMLFILFLALLSFVIHSFIESASWYDVISSLYWFLVAVWFLILWNLAFYSIMIYILNTVIVTDKRVVENKQEGFFKYTLNELELDKIQDISVKIYGPLAAFLDFGDIGIQTAGAQPKFYFTQLPHPEKIKETIMNLKIKS